MFHYRKKEIPATSWQSMGIQFYHGTARSNQKEDDSMLRADVHCVAKCPHCN